MFFKKKKQEETALKQFIESGLKEIRDTASGIFGGMQEMNESVKLLKQAVSENTANLYKRDMAIEDMLELLQERDEKEDVVERMFRELEKSRNELLELACICREQFFLVLSHVEDGETEASREAWKRQLQLLNEAAAKQLDRCGIKEIGSPGERVDYAVHDIIEAVVTHNKDKALTVAQVYSPGLMYGGNVRKKAKVSAYRMNDSED